MAAWNPKANSIFLEARELPSVEARDEYLDQACGDDVPLKADVVALLKGYDNASHFFHSSASNRTSLYTPEIVERPGDTVGPYKLLQEIGEGGMGLVFMAEQKQPVHRTVALKIIKPGMDTRQVVARFEAERQALALMDHPNIARVFDAGATDAGRPYFVMELVKGLPITKYCDEQRLTLRKRLELFIPVCQAVQHAHQKGIIHRDLKPSNVMIALYDGQPVPKVIDFGVAKAAGQKLTDRTMFTEFGAVVGTLEYMSPEQAELNQLDVDTRSDIYSLGVLLYELLTGTTPLDRNRLKQSALQEVLRIIREEEPPKPSTRISTIEQLPAVAAQRSLEPGQFSETVRGEMDWIVMKALDKDRNRRYETANGLFRDIERYLADEPVQAGPPSATYRFRKFVKRNKATALAATLVTVALLAGVAVSTWQAVRATRAETQAIRERHAAEQSARQALDASAAERIAKEAEAAQRKQAEAVSTFLISAFRSPDPELDGRKITIAEVLDRAAEEMKQKLADAPLTDAALLQAIGESYLGLGLYREAIPLLERVHEMRRRTFGPDHLETAKSMHVLTRAYCLAGRFEEAQSLGERLIGIRKTQLGPDHPDTLAAMDSLGSILFEAGQAKEAADVHKDALQRMTLVLGRDHALTLATMKNLAQDYLAAGQTDEAVKLIEEAIQRSKATLGADHPLTLSAMHILGRHYLRAGKLNEALPLCEEVFKRMQARLGPDHPSTLDAMHNVGLQLFNAGRKDEAFSMWAETYGLMCEKLGPEHPNVTQTRNNLAVLYFEFRQFDKAIPLLEENIKFRQAKFGPDDKTVAYNTHILAIVYRQLGRPDDAVSLYVKRLAGISAKFGPDHSATLVAKFDLAKTNSTVGRSKEAQALFEEILTVQIANLGPLHAKTLATYHALGRYDEAIAAAQKALQTRQEELGLDHPDTLAMIVELSHAHKSVRRYADAEHYNRLRIDHTKKPEELLVAQTALGECLFRQGKGDEGVAILQGVLKTKLRRAKTPEAIDLGEAWAKLAESTASTKGMPGKDGLELDGDHDYVIIPSLQFDGQPPWTLEAIVRPVELDHQHDGWSSIVSATHSGSIGLESLGKKWTMDLYTSGGLETDTSLWEQDYAMARAPTDAICNQWQHIAGVWDGQELRLYVDGKLQRKVTGVDYCTELSHGPFFLGADPNSLTRDEVAEGFLLGRLRAVRVSRGVEYTDNFSRPETLKKTPDTIALYDFTIDTGRYAIDRSGHGHHGIIMGAKFVTADK